jgi:uncharacterized membrane protein
MLKKKVFYDKPERSVIKAITYRALILCTDGLVIFLITRRYDLTLGVIVVSNIVSTLIYLLHERAWDTIHWGKKIKTK